MRRAVAAVSVVVVAVGLAACGGGSSGAAASSGGGSPSGSSAEEHNPAAKVLEDAKSALFNAKAVHVAGTETSHGQLQKLDAQFQGQDSAGSLTLNGTATLNAATLRFVNSHGTFYVKAPAIYWQKVTPAQASALAGKWIKVPASDSTTTPLTLQGIAASIDTNDSPLMPKTRTGSLNGRRVIILRQRDGSTLYVSDSTRPLSLKVVNMGKEKGTVTFTNYGRTQTIAPPSGALTPQQAAQQTKPAES